MTAMSVALVDTTPRRLAIAILALAFAALLWHFALFLIQGYAALRFAGGLDYGEGIVWHQAATMFSGQAYGPIDGFPTIVYHYPPLFHIVTAGLSGLTGLDMLAAGRLVSLASALGAAILAGAIAIRALSPDSSRAVRALVAAGATLGVFCCTPIIAWSLVMRVDSLAVMLDFLGIWLGLAALRRPWLIHLAGLAFVAAVYTKQTSIAAPAALYLLLLAIRPALALRGMATAFVAGFTILVALIWATDGGVLRHLFLYNINRFEPGRWIWIGDMLLQHVLLFAAAALVAARVGELRASLTDRSFAGLREKLSQSAQDAGFVLVLIYFATSFLMMLTVAKSGSGINYFVEWMSVLCILVGLSLTAVARVAAGEPQTATPRLLLLVALFLGLHGVLLKRPNMSALGDTVLAAKLDGLSQRIRQADKPVISDDMVAVLRGGKPVVWEPAIFTELSHVGLWNAAPLVDRICKHEFAFFVTDAAPDTPLYAGRYDPIVKAMRQAYPILEMHAGYVLHLPDPAAVCGPGVSIKP
jgi:hypothetical protein